MGRLLEDWLSRYLELPHGIPSKDCIRRVLMRLQPEAFQQCFAEWLSSLVGPAGAKFLSIDGKTLRRSHDRKHQLGTLHLVSVFARSVRGHWGIENTCQWSLDMTFREDDSRTRDRHAAQNLAWLRRFTLSLLKQHPGKKHSLVMKRRMAGWNPSFPAEILFGQTV